MLAGILNAFRVKEIRNKLFVTFGILVLYRLGAHLPVPGVPFKDILTSFQQANDEGPLAILNLFSGGALSRVSVFSLGIMPYITAQIIMQMMQSIIPSLSELVKEGEAGQRRITQYTRYLTVVLAFISALGYLFLFKGSYGVSFAGKGYPELLMDTMVVVTMLAGAILIMWLGEVITQRGIGNGMSLIIFANIMSNLPSSILHSFGASDNGTLMTILIIIVVLAVIPLIVYIERGQRRIPVQYAKRVVGRRVMGGQATYLPIKVNTAGVVPIIFASALVSFPAQIALFFPNVAWLNDLSRVVSSGWVNWIVSVLLIVFFAYFYTAMMFKPDETSDTLRKHGGFIPGVRPGAATVAYIKRALSHITLPGAIFLAVIAVAPSVVLTFTDNALIRSFGGTSILIMVGVALDTMSKIESQLKTHDYEGLFR